MVPAWAERRPRSTASGLSPLRAARQALAEPSAGLVGRTCIPPAPAWRATDRSARATLTRSSATRGVDMAGTSSRALRRALAAAAVAGGAALALVTPALAATPAISATAGRQFSGAVTTVAADCPAPFLPSASINWGDGTRPTSGHIAISGTSLIVTGSHTFSRAGAFTGRCPAPTSVRRSSRTCRSRSPRVSPPKSPRHRSRCGWPRCRDCMPTRPSA